jgi:cell division protein FtsA
MSGVRLEAKVHVVTCAVNAAQNIEKCVRRCGLEIDDIILEQLASAYSVLTDDEKELGVCLVDIGGGTTDIAIFTEGAIRHTAVIPIAGDQVTNDIAMALRTRPSTPKKSRSATPAPWPNWPAPAKPSRCQALATVHRASRVRPWPRWSSRVTTNCSP